MRTVVVGVGNSLMKDEGVGVHVARALADTTLPAGVEVIDAGTDPDVAFDVVRFDRVIIVDAARGGQEPGTIYRFGGEGGLDVNERRQTCHDVGLLQTLRKAAQATPEIVIVGVEPKEIAWGLELSAIVRQSVPRVVRIVQHELRGG